MARTMQPTYVEFRLELDRSGGPRAALLHITDQECITLAMAREEFAPFDSLVDVAQWLVREVRKRVPVRPG